MANLPTRGWMNPVCIMRERRDQFGLHLNQKDLKFGKESLSYGFGCTKERLRDSSEYHAECKGSISASLEPKRSKIRHEMAELCLIYQREVG